MQQEQRDLSVCTLIHFIKTVQIIILIEKERSKLVGLSTNPEFVFYWEGACWTMTKELVGGQKFWICTKLASVSGYVRGAFWETHGSVQVDFYFLLFIYILEGERLRRDVLCRDLFPDLRE